MSNSIFEAMNPMNGIVQQFNQFKRSFVGNPQQQVQQLLNSGKVTQAQYNMAVQKAQQFQRMFGK